MISVGPRSSAFTTRADRSTGLAESNGIEARPPAAVVMPNVTAGVPLREARIHAVSGLPSPSTSAIAFVVAPAGVADPEVHGALGVLVAVVATDVVAGDEVVPVVTDPELAVVDTVVGGPLVVDDAWFDPLLHADTVTKAHAITPIPETTLRHRTMAEPPANPPDASRP
jgi:hypothetical protein